MKYIVIIFVCLFCFSCLQEETDYSALDLEVGHGRINGAEITVDDGLGAIQELSNGYIELWLQSPVQTVTLDLTGSTITDWQIVMRNAISGISLQNSGTVNTAVENQIGTTYTIDINATIGSSYELVFAPSGYQTADAFSFAVLSDIQDAIDSVNDLYDEINNDSSIQFVISAGDLTSQGTKSEIKTFRKRLSSLNVPFYSTAGNHDMFSNNQKYWRTIFGRTSFTFMYKDIVFIFADTTLATIEQRVYGWLDEWLSLDRDKLQFFITHYPAIDPSGIRNGGMANRNEAYKLIAVLLDGDVDVIINGHVHSYYHFDSAGIDSYISGGGGAYPELLDGIERHFIKVTVNGSTKIYNISVVEVD